MAKKSGDRLITHQSEPNQQESTQQESTQTLARSATLLSIGNAASRILGLLREVVIAYFFGASGQVSAFRVASQVPTLFYDFLVGGMLSAALVPVLSDYAGRQEKRDFTRLAAVLLSLFSAVLAILVIILEIAAPQVAWLLAAGLDEFDATLLPLTVSLIRLVAPAVWLFSMAGVLTAILYARQRFTYPALATAIYNTGIVICAPLFASSLGVTSLAIGILSGSLAQMLVMAWDLFRTEPELWQQLRRTFLRWQHPALAKILALYTPIAAGLVVSVFQIGLDRRLASSTGEQSIAWMANATTLQQMPLGLISVAIALAALPTLSQHFSQGNEDAYQQTLIRGLRMVLLLIAPAAIMLWCMGASMTRMLFERGDFTTQDTLQVTLALEIYVVGMIFAAIDFPLNYAFYARNNTILPAVVGVVSVGVYMLVAYGLLESLGYLGLVWADSAKQASHALIMLGFILWRANHAGAGFRRGLRDGLIKISVSAVAMLGAVLAIQSISMPVYTGLLQQADSSLFRFVVDAGYVAIVSFIGVVIYGIGLQLLGVSEVGAIRSLLIQRIISPIRKLLLSL
ncbi:MAG: murein biosynthesis integral membrane protein MurJ [Chloroflexota bacterium]